MGGVECSDSDDCMRICMTMVTTNKKVAENAKTSHEARNEDHKSNFTMLKRRRLDQHITTCFNNENQMIAKEEGDIENHTVSFEKFIT